MILSKQLIIYIEYWAFVQYSDVSPS